MKGTYLTISDDMKLETVTVTTSKIKDDDGRRLWYDENGKAYVVSHAQIGRCALRRKKFDIKVREK